MVKKLSHDKRRVLLLALTSLVVAFVRTYIQYHHLWESIGKFIISWFIHFIAIFLIVLASGACIKANERFFLGDDIQRKGLTFEESIVYVSFVVLVLSVFIFIMISWIPSEDSFYE